MSKKSPLNSDFDTFLTLFRVFWDFSDTFLTLRAGRFGKTFLRLLGTSGPEGLGIPVYGGSNRNVCYSKENGPKKSTAKTKHQNP